MMFEPVDMSVAVPVEAITGADGSITMQTVEPLLEHEPDVLRWLSHWARVAPDRILLAEREGGPGAGRGSGSAAGHEHEREANGGWRVITYAEAFDAVRALGAALLDLGAGPERPLFILSENSIEHAMVNFAAIYVGVPVAPVSPTYAQSTSALGRMRDMASVVQPWVVFCQDGRRFAACLEVVGVPAERVIAVSNVPAGARAYADLSLRGHVARADAVHAALDPDGHAKYMFTSGSTGVPKAVVQTRRMLAAAQQMGVQSYTRGGGRSGLFVQVDWLPWHHVMGGNVVLHRLLQLGGTLYIDDGRPTPDRFAATLVNLREHPPTSYFNVPAGMAMLVGELERDEAFARLFFSRLDFMGYGGASLSEALHERLQAVARRVTDRPLVVSTAYGTTETSGPGLTRNWDAGDIGAIGLPYPGVSVRLLPLDGERGRYELRIKGPNIFSEYLRSPVSSSEAFDEDGYLRLGDAVMPIDMDDPRKGLLFAGRLSEDFKLSSGTWVQSSALRTRLMAACAPLLSDAAIVGEGRDRVSAFAWVAKAACREALPHLREVDEAQWGRDPGLVAMLSARLEAMNRGAHGATSRVDALMVLGEAPSLQHYEVTEKGNLNVRGLLKRRERDAQQLFAAEPPAHVAMVGRARAS